MMPYGLLNLGSILLGLAAWIFPIVNLVKRNKAENRNWVAYLLVSISACAISLFMQIAYQDYLVKIEDWSALMDTSSALVFVSVILLSITLMLNIITLVKYNKNGNGIN